MPAILRRGGNAEHHKNGPQTFDVEAIRATANVWGGCRMSTRSGAGFVVISKQNALAPYGIARAARSTAGRSTQKSSAFADAPQSCTHETARRLSRGFSFSVSAIRMAQCAAWSTL